MPTLELPGFALHYEGRGAGDPLLLIPGFASGAWSWSWQIDELADSFRVIVFDPRGISRSSFAHGKIGKVTIPSIADDLVGLLDELRIDSAHVLGISFGGFVALDLAIRHPERVRRLVLASTSFGGPNHVQPATDVLAAFASTDGLNSADRIRRYLTVAFSPEFVEERAETVDEFCRLREENIVSREAYMQQLEAALSFDCEDRVRDIRASTLVVSGDRDIVVPLQNSRNLAAAIPNARLEIIEDSGHMAFVEKAPEFNRIVRDFLIEAQD